MVASRPAEACDSAQFSAHLSQLLEPLGLNSPSYLVALSGGVDSVALLRLLAATVPSGALRACYIDHQLQAQSAVWKEFCRALCDQLGVEFVSVAIRLDAEQLQKQGVEAAARAQRYNALLALQTDNEVLLTAHHQDDQLETVLFRLERGTGLKGLSGIPEVSWRAKQGRQYCLVRPLLAWPKAALRSYLQGLSQKWIEDLSNNELNFRRNYYRHQVVPQLSHNAHAKSLLMSRQAAEINQAMECKSRQWLAERQTASAAGVDVLTLLDSDFSYLQLLEYRLDGWLKRQLFSLDGKKLAEVLRQLRGGKALGHSPTLARGERGLWIRKRSVWLQ